MFKSRRSTEVRGIRIAHLDSPEQEFGEEQS